MAIDYNALQILAKNTIVNTFKGIPVTIRFLNDSTIDTYAVFGNGLAKNIDNIQNPTSLTGETARYAYVPGIDFYNPDSNSTTTPQVSGFVEWRQNGVLFKKIISSVALGVPIPTAPILFTLGIT